MYNLEQSHLTSKSDAQMQAFIKIQTGRAPLEIGYNKIYDIFDTKEQCFEVKSMQVISA